MRVVITGTVGVGKSTITKEVNKLLKQKHDNVYFYDELITEINPYLDQYYENRSEWSYLLQLDFLLNRYKSVYVEEFEQKKDPKRIAIYDRHFIDDFVFGNMKTVKEDMGDSKWRIYQETFKFLNEKVTSKSKPDYVFMLKATFDNVITRVKTRGRESEASADLDYWKEMYDTYYNNEKVTEHFKNSSKKFIIIDTNNKNTKEIAEEIVAIINK